MSAVLAGIGAGIFVFLGIAHTVFTLQSTPDGGPMMPTDPDVRGAMNVTGGLGLDPNLQSTLYQAWIGFNLSHSLGLLVSGGVLFFHVIDDYGRAVDQLWFVVVALVVPAIYLALAQKFWFDKPRDAIGLAAVLLWAGTIIELL